VTSREKKLLIVVAVLSLKAVFYAGYSMVYKPLQRDRADQAKLMDELSEKQILLDKMARDQKRLPTAKKRSLPADVDVAKREYEAALGYLLRSNGVPAGYTIVPKDAGDLRSIPDIAPKKPAYQRIGYDIRLQKVDLPTVTKVLKAYYDLNLLHQITMLDIKRVEKEGSSGGFARRGGDRADLEITLHTEAIILDGAEQRRTLLPVPIAFAAAGGIGGYQAVLHLPEAGRGIKTQQFPSVLASGAREYLAMEARDVFHGPLPPPVPQPPKGPDPGENKFIKSPPEDIAPYIRLNAITTSSTGVKEAVAWDTATNHYYEMNVRDEDTPSPEFQFVKKYRLGEKWKNLEYNSWKPVSKAEPFVVGEEGTATLRKFLFLGYHEDGLVLKELVSETKDEEKPVAKEGKDGKAPDPKKGAKAPVPNRFDRFLEPKLSKEQMAHVSAIGGLAMTKPAVVEKYHVWRLGTTLATLDDKKAMTEADAKKLLAKGPAKEPAGAELAPTPRSSN
jgi:hypothetical protein